MNKLNLLFVGSIYSDTHKDIFFNNSKRGYQFASQQLQESLLLGFLQNDVNVNVVSIPSLSSFPFGYREPIIRSVPFVFNQKCLGRTRGFVNVIGLKSLLGWGLNSVLNNWYDESCRNLVFVYGLHSQLMSISLQIKQNYPNVELAIIIPDLPCFMGKNKYLEKIGHYSREENIVDQLLPNFKYFILLADKMKQYLRIDSARTTVIEGIYTESDEPRIMKPELPLIPKSVFYAGSLHERYGIMDLVNAFHRTKAPDYSLYLCGTGDSVDKIRKIESVDSRVHYLGKMENKEVRQFEKRVSILVNPRHSNEEFTKYSFPSKTLEYLSSGTPTLMCHLDCIPQEYDDYLYYFEDESIDGYKNKLIQMLEEDHCVLKNRARKASDFIVECKTPMAQVRKILDLFSDQQLKIQKNR